MTKAFKLYTIKNVCLKDYQFNCCFIECYQKNIPQFQFVCKFLFVIFCMNTYIHFQLIYVYSICSEYIIENNSILLLLDKFFLKQLSIYT